MHNSVLIDVLAVHARPVRPPVAFATKGGDTRFVRYDKWSKASPLHGLFVMSAKSLGLDGMNEDPCGIYDKDYEGSSRWKIKEAKSI